MRRPYRRRFLVVRAPESLAPPTLPFSLLPPPLPPLTPLHCAAHNLYVCRRGPSLFRATRRMVDARYRGGACAPTERVLSRYPDRTGVACSTCGVLASACAALPAWWMLWRTGADRRTRHRRRGAAAGDLGPYWTGYSRVYSRGLTGTPPQAAAEFLGGTRGYSRYRPGHLSARLLRDGQGPRVRCRRAQARTWPVPRAATSARRAPRGS
jgi:hypothetical protein